MNIVCDHALLIGYADQTRRVGRQIIERAIRYLEEGELPSRQARASALWNSVPGRWTAGTMVASTLGIAAVAAMGPAAWTELWSSLMHSLFDLARLAHKLVGG